MLERPPITTVEEAVAAVRDGRLIIIVDDEDRENEGDLMVAAEWPGRRRPVALQHGGL
jgi:3,4-dihydroxy-2-butanone 4-phosphate synthase